MPPDHNIFDALLTTWLCLLLGEWCGGWRRGERWVVVGVCVVVVEGGGDTGEAEGGWEVWRGQGGAQVSPLSFEISLLFGTG